MKVGQNTKPNDNENQCGKDYGYISGAELMRDIFGVKKILRSNL